MAKMFEEIRQVASMQSSIKLVHTLSRFKVLRNIAWTWENRCNTTFGPAGVSRQHKPRKGPGRSHQGSTSLNCLRAWILKLEHHYSYVSEKLNAETDCAYKCKISTLWKLFTNKTLCKGHVFMCVWTRVFVLECVESSGQCQLSSSIVLHLFFERVSYWTSHLLTPID